VVIAYLEGALELSDELKEPALVYLIERAFDEARGQYLTAPAARCELH
jgi:hypothetical protein